MHEWRDKTGTKISVLLPSPQPLLNNLSFAEMPRKTLMDSILQGPFLCFKELGALKLLLDVQWFLIPPLLGQGMY